MISRMVDAAMSVEPQAERTDASAVRALVDVIKKEEVSVVVNLHERIQVRFRLLRTCFSFVCLCNI